MRGAYLFTKDRSSWWKLWYSPGQNADNCKTSRDPKTREDDTLDVFFGLDDSLGSCLKLPDGNTVKGEIESVSFVPASSHTMRIIVTAPLGKAIIPDEVLSACDQSNNTQLPTLATVSLRYAFVIKGRRIVPQPGNPPTEYGFAVAPTTNYRPFK